MALTTVKYLVVDNVVDDVPDGAPEVDLADLTTPAQLSEALLRTTKLPPSAEVFLRTARPDGSLRWQPLSALTALPTAGEGGILVAKLVRPKGPAAGGAPRPAGQQQQRPPAPGQQQQQQQQQQANYPPPAQSGGSGGGHGLIGGLLRKIAGGGGAAGARPRPVGGGGMGGMGMGGAAMGGAGLGAAAGGMGAHGGVGGGRTDAEDAAWAQHVQDHAAQQQLEDAAMRQDDADFDYDRQMEHQVAQDAYFAEQQADGDQQGGCYQQDEAAYEAEQGGEGLHEAQDAAADYAEEQADCDPGDPDGGGNYDFDDDGGGGGSGGQEEEEEATYDDDDAGGGDDDDGGDFGGGDDE